MASQTTVFPTMERTVAIIAGGSAAMDSVANQLAALARANAGEHPGPTGRFESMIRVVKAGNGKDRLVVNTDPLSPAKELGHVVVRDGKVVGYARGIHAMRNAVTAMPAVS